MNKLLLENNYRKWERDNYYSITRLTQEIISKIYKEMNDYLENIMNSPSTINRIISYYGWGTMTQGRCPVSVIVFNEKKIVREFKIAILEDIK